MLKAKVTRNLSVTERLERIEKILALRPLTKVDPIDDEKATLEQKRWDEGIANILGYAIKAKDGGNSG